MPIDPLERAIALIKQGQLGEAQKLIKPLITAEPHNLPAWFWFVETCSTAQLRLNALEVCLEYNPDNLQVKQVLGKYRAAVASQFQEVVHNEKLPAYSSLDGQITKTELAHREITSKILEEKEPFLRFAVWRYTWSMRLLSVLRHFAKGFGLLALLVIVIVSSVAVRLLAFGYMLLIAGLLTVLLPVGIHAIVHLIIIVRGKTAKSSLDVMILFSHLSLFLCLITQPDFDDRYGATGLTQILSFVGITTRLDSSDDLNVWFFLSCVFGIYLIVSWFMIFMPRFYKNKSA